MTLPPEVRKCSPPQQISRLSASSWLYGSDIIRHPASYLLFMPVPPCFEVATVSLKIERQCQQCEAQSKYFNKGKQRCGCETLIKRSNPKQHKDLNGYAAAPLRRRIGEEHQAHHSQSCDEGYYSDEIANTQMSRVMKMTGFSDHCGP